MPARVFPQAQSPSTQTNISAILEALPLPNKSQLTTLAGVLISRLPLDDLPAPETMPARAFS